MFLLTVRISKAKAKATIEFTTMGFIDMHRKMIVLNDFVVILKVSHTLFRKFK